ncbi:capsule biosynthesis protein [Bordetella sp. BOR01]|uniref:capsule biosynthesis protein n=1 Tax=Bordetella sp. BOR01 TaxID=2854779 RepID=UPI0021080AFB|nr:capsule biosynthesis protein CapA [Bordetella sp. BOR01]
MLGQALRDAGHHVHKINFNGGDSLYWKGGGTIAHRNGLADLAEFYQRIFDRASPTDLVLFGDCRPLHMPAIRVAERTGARVHVFEEGYFRPYWITLERSGVNARSLLPRDPDWYNEIGPAVPKYENGEPFESSFLIRACHDVWYHVGNLQNPVFYPGYRTHAQVSAPVEYCAYLRRALSLPLAQREDKKTIEDLIRLRRRFWLLPLQLNSDTQIRDHSPFRDMEEVVEKTVESFSMHAGSGEMLLIKNHPLDTGLCGYKKLVSGIARKFDVEKRVVYVETGHLPTILNHACGVVTVNSTVGSSALVHSRPTIALASAIYNMPDLTFQGNLDEFWSNAAPPDADLFQHFRNVVIHATQVNGGFYSRSGMKLGIRNSVARLLREKSPLEELLGH